MLLSISMLAMRLMLTFHRCDNDSFGFRRSGQYWFWLWATVIAVAPLVFVADWIGVGAFK